MANWQECPSTYAGGLTTETVILNVVAVAVGAVVTWLVSKAYYLRSMERTVSGLKPVLHKLNLILEALETGHIAEWVRDESGEPISVVIHLSAKATGTSHTSGSARGIASSQSSASGTSHTSGSASGVVTGPPGQDDDGK